jgi:hypothetical protein
MTIERSSIVLGAVCLAMGPAVAGFFVYKGLTESRKSDRYVSVRGLAERVEKADLGVWQISYKVAGNDMVQLNAQLTTQAEQVKNYLVSIGFKVEEISKGTPRVVDLMAQEYANNTQPANRFVITGTTFVKTPNVDLVSASVNKLGTLIDQGINLVSFDATYRLNKFNDLRPEMIAAATKNAREMADGFAAVSGTKIMGIRDAHQGAIEILNPDSSPNNSWDSGETSLYKKLRVVSSFDFYIKE